MDKNTIQAFTSPEENEYKVFADHSNKKINDLNICINGASFSKERFKGNQYFNYENY